MALARVKFSVDGTVQYERAFEVMASRAQSLRDPLEEIADDLRGRIGEQFLTEGAAMGTPWPPLSPEYARWKEEHYPGRPILVRDAKLRPAATAREAFTVTDDRMTYELSDPFYGPFHHRGSGHNPVRTIVKLTQDMRRHWDRLFHQWVNSLRTGPIRGR